MNSFQQIHHIQQNIAQSNLNLDIRLVALKKSVKKVLSEKG